MGMKKIVLLVKKDSNKLRKYLHMMVLKYCAEKYGLSDKEVQIKKDNGGKLYITIQGEELSDFFNISHTSDIGVVIFLEHKVGSDIERIKNCRRIFLGCHL